MMEHEPFIRIGMTTSGSPVIKGNRLENLLIGKGFHWQRTINAELRGHVEVFREKNLVINSLPVEEYLKSVVGSEMNPTAPVEFLKAHAVISRSWVLGKLNKKKPATENAGRENPHPTGLEIITWEDENDHFSDCYNVCSDDHCQRYQGVQNISETLVCALDDTRGLVLSDRYGNIADCRFSKCCGGRTELFSSCWQEMNPEYLQSIEDPWCDLSDMHEERRNTLLSSILKDYDRDIPDVSSISGEWYSEISLDTIREKIQKKYGRDPGNIHRIKVLKRGPSGRIFRLSIKGDRDEIIIGKELAIRRMLSDSCLKSSAFAPVIESGMLKMSGKGWGHGVGLCQIGAARMAMEGNGFRDILSFYYPHSTLTKIYE